MKITRWLFAGLILIAGCARPHEADDEAPDAGDELIGVMSEGELDRVVDATAEALRQSPLAHDATQARHVLPPEWVNATDVPVQRPAEVVDRFTELLNSRIGGSLQFERRTWVAQDQSGAASADSPASSMPASSAPAGSMPAATPMAKADLVSRLTLMPSKEGSTDRTLRLRLELFKDGATTPVFEREEEFAVAESKIAEARTVERRRVELVSKPPAEGTGAAQPAATADLRFVSESVQSRVALSKRRVSELEGGGLEVAVRAVARRAIRLRVQAIFMNEAGEQVEVSRPAVSNMKKGQQAVFTFRSQLPAKSHVLLFDRD